MRPWRRNKSPWRVLDRTRLVVRVVSEAPRSTVAYQQTVAREFACHPAAAALPLLTAGISFPIIKSTL